MDLKTIATPHVPVRYFEGGTGPALVFLHGAGGLLPEDPFLNALARKYHVHAPLLPGYGDSEECGELRDMLDFTLHSWDVVDALGLRDPILVGHSMGGMIAAEMAAVAPRDVSRLGLIAPAGLWLDAVPIPDFFSMLPFQLASILFFDEKIGAQLMGAGGGNFADPEWLKNFLVRNARQLGTAGKILFPIPDRGLAQRLYRIKAKTVIVWGESDKLIPLAYAEKFRAGIRGAELVVIREAAHMVPLEQTAQVVAALERLG
ncbi:MAG TPA: alpha/beta hydrolase [Stellaceae bacterium]|jgi:pimeloyl-ACP methyl ester carboxylesterase|nr:alpha/beta hydrolase [Stellaceae bacterium]